MERLLIIGALFVVAGLCEIGGGYLVWGWMRDHKPLLWALLGALSLAALPRFLAWRTSHTRQFTPVAGPLSSPTRMFPLGDLPPVARESGRIAPRRGPPQTPAMPPCSAARSRTPRPGASLVTERRSFLNEGAAPSCHPGPRPLESSAPP